MTAEFLIIALLATYRLTFMLNSEDGPANIFGRLRTRLGVVDDTASKRAASNWVAEGVLCFYCLSVWIAFAVTGLAIVAMLVNRMDIATFVLLPFALSGGAVFLKKWVG